MPVTWLTAPHSLTEPVELDRDGSGTQHEFWGNTRATAQVTLKCVYSQRHAILDNILDHGKAWPYHTGNDLRAVSGTIKPFKGVNAADGSGLSYQFAEVQVNFEVASPESGGTGAFYQEELTPAGQLLTVPPDEFQWGVGAFTPDKVLRDEEAPSRPMFGFEYVVRWFNMSSIPAEVLTHENCCNNAPVESDSLGLVFPTETLLMNPARISRTVKLGGTNRWTVELRWSFKAAPGWNEFWRAKTQSYQKMYLRNATDAGAHVKIFTPKNMSGLLP